MSSEVSGTSPRSDRYEYVVVGAGPAGLQMGYHLATASRRYLVLEAADAVGAFFLKFPRHRRLLSINKRFNYFAERDFNLRHDWNSLLSDDDGPLFTAYSDELYPRAEDLGRYLREYAEKYQLNIRYQCRVSRIERISPEYFAVTDQDGRSWHCRCILLATGATRPWLPDIEGIELAEGYEDHDLETSRYRNKRVAVIGRGNSAFEVANHLAGEAAIVHIFAGGRVEHAWQSHYSGDLRAINNTVLDMVQLKSLFLAFAFNITKISKLPSGEYELHCDTEFHHWDPPRRSVSRFRYDHVIRCTGWKYADPSMFPAGACPEIDGSGKFFLLNSAWETSLPDIYCIGTHMQSLDHRAASSFIHGFRYNVRTAFRLLEEKYQGVSYPRSRLPLGNADDLAALAAFLVTRMSTTSGLFQQFGFLCDAAVCRDGRVEVYPELPVSYSRERFGTAGDEHLVTVTFEFGFENYPSTAASLDFLLPSDPANPSCSAYLHPVLRHYHSGELVEEAHLHDTIVVRYDVFTNLELKAHPTGHYHRIMNFFNRIAKVTDQLYDEPNYSYAPVPGAEAVDRRPVLDPDGGAPCQFVPPVSTYHPALSRSSGRRPGGGVGPGGRYVTSQEER